MKKWFILLCLIIIGVYGESLGFWFSQDDFIHLYSAQADSLGQVFNFFNPYAHFQDIFFYRPLTTQFFFFVNNSLFGLNPLPYHIEALLLHLVNTYLVFLIIHKLWKDKAVALFSSLFYGISAVHFLSLYYISAFQQIGRTLFILVFLLGMIYFIQTKKLKFYLLSCGSFLLALLSKETSVIAPLFVLPLMLFLNKQTSGKTMIREYGKLSIPFFVLLCGYITMRILGFQSIFQEGSYQLTFHPTEILQNIKWYLLWSVGLPEVLSTYPSLKPDSLKQFMYDIPYASWVVLGVGIWGALTLGFLKNIVQINKNYILGSILFFIIPLLPVIILHQHYYPQYLDLSLLGLVPLLTRLYLHNILSLRRYAGYGALFVLAIVQIISIQSSQASHWTTHRSQVAYFYYQDIKKVYPQIPTNQLYLVGDNKTLEQVSYALAQGYAFKVWYKNPQLQVYYTRDTSPKDIFYHVSMY